MGKEYEKRNSVFLISYKFDSKRLLSDIWGVSLEMRTETRIACIYPVRWMIFKCDHLNHGSTNLLNVLKPPKNSMRHYIDVVRVAF